MYIDKRLNVSFPRDRLVKYWVDGSRKGALEVGLGKKPGSEKPNRTRSEKVVSTPNQN